MFINEWWHDKLLRLVIALRCLMGLRIPHYWRVPSTNVFLIAASEQPARLLLRAWPGAALNHGALAAALLAHIRMRPKDTTPQEYDSIGQRFWELMNYYPDRCLVAVVVPRPVAPAQEGLPPTLPAPMGDESWTGSCN